MPAYQLQFKRNRGAANSVLEHIVLRTKSEAQQILFHSSHKSLRTLHIKGLIFKKTMFLPYVEHCLFWEE
jgi:hypothetical protein